MWIKLEDTKTDLGVLFTMTVDSDPLSLSYGQVTMTATSGTPFSGVHLTSRITIAGSNRKDIVLKPLGHPHSTEVVFEGIEPVDSYFIEGVKDVIEDLEDYEHDVLFYMLDNGYRHMEYIYDTEKITSFAVNDSGNLVLGLPDGHIQIEYFNNLEEIKKKIGYED